MEQSDSLLPTTRVEGTPYRTEKRHRILGTKLFVVGGPALFIGLIIFVLYLVLYQSTSKVLHSSEGNTMMQIDFIQNIAQSNETVPIARASRVHTPQIDIGLDEVIKTNWIIDDYDVNVAKVGDFNTSTDVLVVLHIQKTGGSQFTIHLAKELNEIRCKCKPNVKKCDCSLPNEERTSGAPNKKLWIFSRRSVGWVCGLHADWLQLQACVTKTLDTIESEKRERRYMMVTFLRSPVSRFLSEWQHVKRGATWKNALLWCDGRSATLDEVPFCYSGENWAGVSLPEFLDCPHNLAFNRQTRMLGNLSLVGCYNRSAMPIELREAIILKSAVENLRKFVYFGLTEYQHESQLLFEKTFATTLTFSKDWVQREKTKASKSREKVSPELLERVKNANSLDLKLYHFARGLFFARLEFFNIPLPKIINESEALTSSIGDDDSDS